MKGSTDRLWRMIAIALLALAWTEAGAAAALRGDVNGDGEVTIADANATIDLILASQYTALGDVNSDGEVSIADVNAVIDIILNGSDSDADAPVVGGDISMLTAYEAHQQLARTRYGVSSARYYDRQGNTISGDLISWLKQQGWNAARVRLFVNPEEATAAAIGEGVIQNLDTVQVLGRRIKQAGLKFMLDFHYSDTWADPSSQYTPAAWADLDDEALAQQVYDYTRDCLQQLKAAGAEPDYIQTGNEISYGMLWGPVGTASSQLKRCYTNSDSNWPRLISLLNAAIRACREVCPCAQVILHTERVAQPSVLLNFYQRMQNGSVDFDIIGLSYYPYYHGLLTSLNSALTSLEQRFDKPIMIVETGYSYHYTVGSIDCSSTWPLTYEGQRSYAADLITQLKQHSQVKGLFWWFPEANEYGLGGSNWSVLHVTSGWYNAGLWDHETGRALPALDELQSFIDP